MMSRFHTIMLAATAAAALLAPAASAQTVAPTRIVAFGDSYADDGNLFELTRTSQPQVYPTGRFSGGTNYIDTLQSLFGAPQLNFAIGGAFSGPGNTGNNNIVGPGIPGFQFEVASFLAGGGGGVFPTVTPRFEANDLLALSIGGNDARAYQFGGGTVAGAAARAAISVAETRSGLDRLVAAGARNIAVLAGNVGDLPEVRGLPIAAVGSAFSTAFNAGLQAPLAGYAADGALIHYLDLAVVGNQIRANPGRYGLVSAGACTTACVLNPEVQKQFLFYVDQLHLTSAGFAIVAQYFQNQIEAPGLLGAATDIGLSSVSAFERTLDGRNELKGAGNPDRPFGLYLLAVTDRHDRGDGPTDLAYDYDDSGIAGGFEYSPGGGVLAGVALSYTQPKADFAGLDARYRTDAFHVGVHGAFEASGFIVSGTAAYGEVDYRLRRRAVVDDIRSETDGKNYAASLEASYGFPLTSALSVGPVVSAKYARTNIDGYTEIGDAALTQIVERQKLDSLIGEAGLEARAKLDGALLAVEPYLSATVAKQFQGDGTLARFAGTYAPTIVNRITVGNRSEDVYGRLEAGASFAIGDRLSAQIQGAASIEKPDGNDYGGFAGLKLSF